jgi:hypothetical protein
MKGNPTMSPAYKAGPPRGPAFSQIPPDRLAIVLADSRAGIHSPALYSSLGRASCQVELADLRDAWIEVLIVHGIAPLRASMFVQKETLRAEALLQTGFCYRADGFTSQEEAA